MKNKFRFTYLDHYCIICKVFICKLAIICCHRKLLSAEREVKDTSNFHRIIYGNSSVVADISGFK